MARIINTVLDTTTPGSDLVKILIGTQAPPQSVAESLELALNVALDMLPGGKAFKAFKGSGGQLLLNKLKQQIKKQAGKVVQGIKKLVKARNLPTTGKIRFIPRPADAKSGKILQKNGGFVDKFGNVWKRDRTKSYVEWDVQLSNTGKEQLGHLSRSGKHINVSSSGKLTH